MLSVSSVVDSEWDLRGHLRLAVTSSEEVRHHWLRGSNWTGGEKGKLCVSSAN